MRMIIRDKRPRIFNNPMEFSQALKRKRGFDSPMEESETLWNKKKDSRYLNSKKTHLYRSTCNCKKYMFNDSYLFLLMCWEWQCIGVGGMTLEYCYNNFIMDSEYLERKLNMPKTEAIPSTLSFHWKKRRKEKL